MSLLTQLTQASMTFAQKVARDTSRGAMNSLVIVTRPAQAVFNETSREYEPATRVVIYDHPTLAGSGYDAGVTNTSGPLTMDLGDEPQYYSNVTVYLPKPITTMPRVNDIVEVVGGIDTDLNGRFFRVMDVPLGGRIDASVALSCTGIVPSREWIA